MRVEVNGYDFSIDKPQKAREGKIYICKTNVGWYRLFRQGERSWGAVCVVPKDTIDYTKLHGVMISGNAGSIIGVLESCVAVSQWYLLNNEVEYRKLLMSIMGTGDVYSKFDIEYITDEEEL